MNTLTIAWMALPFFVGLSAYLLPTLARYLSLTVSLISIGFALQVLVGQLSFTLPLLDHFGVTVMVDSWSGYFILTNALVTTAVLFYCWSSGKTAFFYTQLTILHGSVNAVFISADFISVYVALEVLSIAAFLLIAYPRTDRSIWVGLRYLFVSNTTMLFYLVGAVLVYQASGSFAFSGLNAAPTEAMALILVALLTKGGVFVSGLWLPLTHSESETPVSAMLSGVAVKAGVFPLIRCALMVESVAPVIQLFGIGAALLGVILGTFERDTKRVLALSTVSQMGWLLVAPAVSGFYALAHGLVKATIFMIAGNLPSRDLGELQQKPMSIALWVPLTMASLSISGFPLFAGFGAKVLTLSQLAPVQAIAMNIAATGTAILYGKFIFLPHQRPATLEERPALKPGFWFAIGLLITGVIIANSFYLAAYTLPNILKVLAIIAIGWLAHIFVFQRSLLKLSRMFEQLDHLIGVMSVMLVLLFWMILA